MFIAGVLLLLDTGFPTATEAMQVDGHSSHVDTRVNNTGNFRDTSYNLKFIAGRVDSCSVGYSAYTKLHYGDTVSVKTTKIFKKCISIARDGRKAQGYPSAKLRGFASYTGRLYCNSR